jgi:hypothetical protein
VRSGPLSANTGSMANDRGSCGHHEELSRTTGFRLTRCSCGTVHLHMVKGGVTLQLSDTMLAELVNAAAAAQRKVEATEATPVRHPSSAPTN